jgi:hypothetical protein
MFIQHGHRFRHWGRIPGKHHGSNMAQPEKNAAAAGLSMALFPKGLQKGIINTLMIFL